MFLSVIFCISIKTFAACTWINCTFRRNTRAHPCIQALKAAQTIDTFTNFILSSFKYLESPLFVCEPASSHGDKINNTSFQKTLSYLWFTYAGNSYHWNRNVIFYGLDQIFSPTLGEGDRLYTYTSCLV